MENNLMEALEQFQNGIEESKANKSMRVRQKILERALQNVNSQVSQEEFKRNLEEFLSSLDDHIIEAGVNVYFGRPREGACVHAQKDFKEYSFYLEDSIETSVRRYTLKICYAYKQQQTEVMYLKKRMEGFLAKVIRLPGNVTDEALEAIINHLNPDYTMEVGVCGFQAFKALVSNSNGAELICLDGLPQGRDHICQALVKDGFMWIFATGVRPRNDNLTFRLRKQEEP